jgi:hypothetical protein
MSHIFQFLLELFLDWAFHRPSRSGRGIACGFQNGRSTAFMCNVVQNSRPQSYGVLPEYSLSMIMTLPTRKSSITAIGYGAGYVCGRNALTEEDRLKACYTFWSSAREFLVWMPGGASFGTIGKLCVYYWFRNFELFVGRLKRSGNEMKHLPPSLASGPFESLERQPRVR